jgi:hypothetical protein
MFPGAVVSAKEALLKATATANIIVVTLIVPPI